MTTAPTAPTARVRHVYSPRGAGRRLFTEGPSWTDLDGVARPLGAIDPLIVLDGPAGTGKSRACLERLHSLMLRFPGARGAVVRRWGANIRSTAKVTLDRFVLPEAITHGEVAFYTGGARGPSRYEYRNGSTIDLLGLNDPSRIMSSEYDVVYLQEATECTLTEVEMLSSRMRNGVLPFQQIIADCNPSHPGHWIKRKGDLGEIRLMPTRHQDNPRLYDLVRLPDGRTAFRLTGPGGAYLARLDAHTGATKARLRHGLWVQAEGAVFAGYDPGVHVVAGPLPPQAATWARHWSVDFGMSVPTALLCAAEHPQTKALIIYRQVYLTGVSGRELWERHVRPLVTDATTGRWTEPHPRTLVGDHDKQGQASWEEAGGPPIANADKNDLPDAIELVAQRLKMVEHPHPGVPPSPGLLILADSLTAVDPVRADRFEPTCLQDELPAYVWDTDLRGRVLRDKPRKENDHAIDALRYLVTEVDRHHTPRLRFLDGR